VISSWSKGGHLSFVIAYSDIWPITGNPAKAPYQKQWGHSLGQVSTMKAESPPWHATWLGESQRLMTADSPSHRNKQRSRVQGGSRGAWEHLICRAEGRQVLSSRLA
jgi:hypothetical protein